MTLHIGLTHRTTYRYDRPIGVGPQVIRLRPAPHCRTPILSYSLKLDPQQHFINWQQDPFGNYNARIVIPEKTDQFSVTVDLIAGMAVINPFDFFLEESAQIWPLAYDPDLKRDLAPYLEVEAAPPLLSDFLAGFDKTSRSTIDFLCDLNREVRNRVNYSIRMEPGVQTTQETLEKASGSCRDSGWLLVQLLRQLGFAARFVSGYLIQLRPDVQPADGKSGATADFTDLHAWAEVYVPGAGWIGLDATSGLLAGEGHIPLAATPNPASAAPITGSHEPAEVTFSYEMAVQRIAETPRVTLPYTEDQWQRIFSCGHYVDDRLARGDVRLSMGGEPTFVAIGDLAAAEWNTAALGPTKRRYADELVHCLRKQFAPGGLVQHGQGKWYPGEPLPRWAFALYWRTDGKAVWQDPRLIAREHAEQSAGIDDAAVLTSELCEQLGLPRDSGIPAYEDPVHCALAEQSLPENVLSAKGDGGPRAGSAGIVSQFENRVGQAACYVLPIQARESPKQGRCWVTERWRVQRGRLFLVPGDSPAGFRLPLASLLALDPLEVPHVLPNDPFECKPGLADGDTLLEQRRSSVADERPEPVRTAMAIEPREGVLRVFMPPVSGIDDYLALIAAIESAASATGLVIQIEGYSPPHDPRLNNIKVTPDPGVIEVNIHPATNWDEAAAITTVVYDEARSIGLGTEKFLIDGRQTGTGGGNHLVFGGITPADSPFLRRPDLLASIVTYWQNHPSLSFLFAGMFIGPTSQAPRLDEARHESLFELEIALEQIPHTKSESIPPWLADRLFRHLLVDVTGNTHRAEICIDKLYSPDGPTGRLGLVEFRSFEMPPHPRMSLAQQLLLRALIVKFWEKPYRGKPIRWGTSLHDRFMLPHFLWSDFADVIAGLQNAGLPVELEWFRPHLNFRLPAFGTVETGTLEMEIRQALEPWHVLGEESTGGGTARYVDSSLERAQVLIKGLSGERYAVACNGRQMPLSPAGVSGQKVAGVRYRSWLPASCLHPTIKPHVPLTFDIIDTWSGRSLGGCRYHATHPGGRNFEVLPVNSNEAEGRRLARFEAFGHTPGQAEMAAAKVNPDYPLTLDLRRNS